MAIRFDADSDGVYVTSGLPTPTSYTVTVWAFIPVGGDRNDYANILQFMSQTNDETSAQAIYFGTGLDGTSMAVATEGGTTTASVNMVLGTWYRLAYTVNGTQIAFYYGAGTSGPLTKVTVTAADRPSVNAKLWVGRDQWSGWWNGRLCALKMWSRVHSDAEIAAEFTQFAPGITTNLVRYHRWSTTSMAPNAGSAATSFTAGTTAVTVEADPAGVPETSTVTGSASATLALTASATGSPARSGTGSATLELTASTSAARHTAESAGATLALTASSAGSKGASNPAEIALELTATATGQRVYLGLAELELTASATGSRATSGEGEADLALTASSSGTRTNGAEAVVSVELTATSSGSSTRAGLGSATIVLTASATGSRISTEVAPAALIARAANTVPYEVVVVARVPQTSGQPTFIEVDPIGWTGLSYTDELGAAQSCQIGAKISTLTEAVLQRLRSLAELATEIWIYRQGRVVFAGPLLTWQVQGESITINAAGLLAYTKMMVVNSDLVFKQVDQFVIARTLIDQWQSLEFGNFGIDTSSAGTSGVLRDATYLAKEMHNVGQRLGELGKRRDGFDLAIDPGTRKLRLSYPQQGIDRSAGEDAIVFDQRNITSPNVICSSAPGDVASEAYGTGTGQETIYGVKSNLVRRSQYGRTAYTATYDGVSEQATLDAYNQAAVDVRDRALMIPGPDTRVSPDADLSSYEVGDTVDYRLHDQLGLGGAFRLRKRTVSVSKTGRESVSVAFT